MGITQSPASFLSPMRPSSSLIGLLAGGQRVPAGFEKGSAHHPPEDFPVLAGQLQPLEAPAVHSISIAVMHRSDTIQMAMHCTDEDNRDIAYVWPINSCRCVLRFSKQQHA